jgi:mRNA interferase RelE/StbE
MSYKVQIAAGALKEIRALPAEVRRGVGVVINELAGNPRPAGARRITDIPDCYRVRSGAYRIVYTIKDEILTINVVTVGHRREVYKGLRGKVKGRA